MFCAFALISVPSSIYANEPATTAPNNGSLLLRWIDVRGNVNPSGKITEMKWVWNRASEHDAQESPALRLSVLSHLPADWQPKRVTGDGVTMIEPFSQRGDGQTMVIDLRSANARLRFEFEDSKGVRSEMSLVIEASMSHPYTLIRPECSKADLRFIVHRNKGIIFLSASLH